MRTANQSSKNISKLIKTQRRTGINNNTTNNNPQVAKICGLPAKISIRSPLKKTPTKKPLGNTKATQQQQQKISENEGRSATKQQPRQESIYFSDIDECLMNQEYDTTITNTQSSCSNSNDNCTNTDKCCGANKTRLAPTIEVFEPSTDTNESSGSEWTPRRSINMIEDTTTNTEFAKVITDISPQNDKEQVQNLSNPKQQIEEAMEVEVPELNVEEEIRNFEKTLASNEMYTEIFLNMVHSEKYYTPDPNYFEAMQPELNPLMRSILVDWMMEVSSEFFMKRETIYIAINYLDRYLSTVPKIQKWELQLVGLSALLLASKMEEVYPHRVSEFARSADNGYTVEQILDMELKMSQALEWKLTPTTMFTWANWYMTEWDSFIDSSPVVYQARMINNNPNNELICFKTASRESYAKYRELMQLLDCAILKADTLRYNTRALIASFLYLIIGKYYKQFTLSEIIHDIPMSSYFLFNDTQGLNYMFQEFLRTSFGYKLEDLLPTIQYAATFFSLPISYDLPHAVKANPQILKGHYEEFLCYQTQCPSNLKYIKNIQKK